VFRGSYIHTLDDKGRLIVPHKLRARLGETFVLTKGLDHCLFVFPEEKYVAFLQSLLGRPELRPAEPGTEDPLAAPSRAPLPINQEQLEARRTLSSSARALQRYFIASACEVQADSTGRIPLPASLRAHAGIEREAVIAGAGNRLEIWAADRWAEVEESLSDEAVAEVVEALGAL
jgi:MraZ protein